MSKRKQTENLHLYAYELTQGLPTFLKDWSDNMAVLDGAHSSVLALINALDGRLTSAEETITDLSPESIQDYKIRLDALEKKVVVNVNNIKDVNVKINTINAQIRSINVEQGVQNNRILALESLGASHTELINGLRQDVGSVSDRVTNLEECCEVVKREIVDLQRDVDGFNEDITAMAGQIEDLSNTVNQLTELVNSLQLDVVAERLDAFEDSLNGLLQRMVTAESNITSQGEELIVHGERITENAGDIADIKAEIGNSDYSEIGSTVSGSLVELANRIRALTPQEYQQLVERLDYVEVSLEGKANNTTVYQLSNRVGATESDLSTAKTDISSLQNGLSVVSSDVQENVDAIQNLGVLVANNKGDADGKIANIQAVIPSDASANNPLLTLNSSKLTREIILYEYGYQGSERYSLYFNQIEDYKVLLILFNNSNFSTTYDGLYDGPMAGYILNNEILRLNEIRNPFNVRIDNAYRRITSADPCIIYKETDRFEITQVTSLSHMRIYGFK